MYWITPDRIAASLRAAEAGPAPADLADAPRLSAWSIVIEPDSEVIRLHGRVAGHPEIDDPTLTTSAVVALDAGDDADGTGDDGTDGWARTLSRWYRLDGASFRPADPATRDAELAMLQRALTGYRRHLAAALEAEREGASPDMTDTQKAFLATLALWNGLYELADHPVVAALLRRETRTQALRLDGRMMHYGFGRATAAEVAAMDGPERDLMRTLADSVGTPGARPTWG